VLLLGIDFTSRPSTRKPITLAAGHLTGPRTVTLDAVHAIGDFDRFEQWLMQPGPWLAACDFPFGLPREFVQSQGWPMQWPALIRHYASHSREALRDRFKAFCDARPAGNKFAHRAVDLLARSSPSMKWVNPPVAWMLLEGAPRLLAANVTLPGLYAGDPQRLALEAYPALVARPVIGDASYKSDDPAKQNDARRQRREAILAALVAGCHPLGITLAIPDDTLHDSLINDGQADRLDATLCLVQAAWAAQHGAPGFGVPSQTDPLEGWILTVPAVYDIATTPS
jgi:hypothetical protein